MLTFPRIKPFKFEYQNPYVIPQKFVGRVDLIAHEIYGYTSLYKPLAAANHIRMTLGHRLGIRPIGEAIEKDRVFLGESTTYVSQYMENHIETEFDWMRYGDISKGSFSDAYEGRLLLVPSFQSAKAWMDQYNIVEVK
jgi:hypothetical protein